MQTQINIGYNQLFNLALLLSDAEKQKFIEDLQKEILHEEDEISLKAEIIQSIEELNQIKKGLVKARPARELIDEL